jgi:hypothetical protein
VGGSRQRDLPIGGREAGRCRGPVRPYGWNVVVLLKMLAALVGGLVGLSLPLVLISVPVLVVRRVAAGGRNRRARTGSPVLGSAGDQVEVDRPAEELELDLDFPGLVLVGEPNGDEDVLLEALAALYSASHLAIPSMRAQPVWSSACEAMEAIFFRLVAARVTERGFEPGSRLHQQLTHAGVVGARTMTRELARWN